MWHATIALLAVATTAEALTVEAVEASIQSSGGPVTIQRYFSCDDTGQPAYDLIETGDQRWLNVAVRLLDDSDGCVTTSLTSSIASALPRAPSRVLRLLDTKPVLTSDRVCVPFMSEDDNPRKQLRYLRTVEATLQAFDGAKLKRQRDTCLREVKDAMATIGRLLTTRSSRP